MSTQDDTITHIVEAYSKDDAHLGFAKAVREESSKCLKRDYVESLSVYIESTTGLDSLIDKRVISAACEKYKPIPSIEIYGKLTVLPVSAKNKVKKKCLKNRIEKICI